MPIEPSFQGLFGLCLSVVMTQLEYSAKTASNPAISQILEPKVNDNDIAVLLENCKILRLSPVFLTVNTAKSTQQELILIFGSHC